MNLRLNLIAKPSKLARGRTITFALQATPTKPMPETPYNWRRWWTTGTTPDTQDAQFNFWGANMYWGGRNFATSLYSRVQELRLLGATRRVPRDKQGGPKRLSGNLDGAVQGHA